MFLSFVLCWTADFLGVNRSIVKYSSTSEQKRWEQVSWWMCQQKSKIQLKDSLLLVGKFV